MRKPILLLTVLSIASISIQVVGFDMPVAHSITIAGLSSLFAYSFALKLKLI
tara:strand:- start:1091 stop:1246 length:156 start_codon:yes stop_codon:yes gene_type:complete